MPFINTKTNIALSRKQKELAKGALADCIAAINPAFTGVLMCDFEDSCALSIGGDSIKPCAVATVYILERVLIETPSDVLDKVLVAITEVLSKTFVIDKDHIHTLYVPAPKWVYNGEKVN